MSKNKWKSAESAPKDVSVFLGNFGYPWAVATVWNECDEKFVHTSLQAAAMSDGTMDTYFENEYFDDLISWREMPAIDDIGVSAQHKRKKR